jgi:SAM-dependent methyltransferase
MERDLFYASDLAYVHHVGFGRLARRAAPRLLRILRRAGIRGGTLVDLGCGSGEWAAAALRAGFHVIGVDRSAAMIHLARRLAPRARFHCRSLHQFPLPACHAVTALGESLNYTFHGDDSTTRLDRLFARVARALVPGGVFLFDVLLREGKPLPAWHWRRGQDWAVLSATAESPARRAVIRRILIFRRSGGRWRLSLETHRVRPFARREVLQALRDAGLAAQSYRAYEDLALLPRRRAFVARKQI